MIKKKPCVLMILDGFGESSIREGNAILNARTPHLDYYRINYPFTILKASGEAVGLPEGQIGSSEVGHVNIGAGRIVYQSYMKINHAIYKNKLKQNPAFIEAMENVKIQQSALHLVGLFSDAGVHSHINHFYALIEVARSYQIPLIFIHAILDGRDTKRKHAIHYINDFENRYRYVDKYKPQITTIIGRYYAMDRDKRWDRTKKAYDLFTFGKNSIYKSYTAQNALLSAYARGETDEFILPTVIINKKRKPIGVIKDRDSVICINFRPDRVRQIMASLTEDNFTDFDRYIFPKAHYVCMTKYNKDFKLPIAFPPSVLKNTLGEVLSIHKKKQIRIAETEKYAHITFFLNCQKEVPFDLEERVIVKSPNVPTYDLKPEMSVFLIEKELLKHIEEESSDIIITNLANADMVGHTGIYKASIQAVEILDAVIHRIAQAVLNKDGHLLITADHGNVESLLDEYNKPLKAHTTNPVPCFFISKEKYKLRSNGILADVAPTILDLLNIPKPKEMTGNSLFLK